MRTLAAVLLPLLLAGPLAAQHRSRAPVGGFGNVIFPGGVKGFGNVLTPGTPKLPPFSITDPSFPIRLGRTVAGHPRFSGGRVRGDSPVFIPYPYPVAYPQDFYGQQQPQVVVVYPQQQQAPVSLNQNFGVPAQPMVQEIPPEEEESEISNIQVYQAPVRSTEEMAAAVPTAPYYLIAFKDHSIYSAVAYWIDGDTLHYFTSGNNHNQVSLSLVDRDLTERLNRERKVAIQLPK
jgi:hypothetical protein